MTFNTEGLSALVNWGIEHKQETLHHMMIGPNQYFPQWFWKNNYTASELDQLLERYITTLMTANDNKRKMNAWNIFNEMLVNREDSGEYKKDGPGRGNCIWMRLGFEADQSGLKGAAKINDQHPVVFRKALKYASMATGKLEIRECQVDEINRKSDALYQLIKHLLNSGVRVDAIGIQSHLNVNQSYDWDSVKKNIRRFKDLGVEVYITELDVSMGWMWKKSEPFPQDYEKLQAERYYGLVKAAREAGVHRIDTWGLSEGVNKYWLVGQNPRLFDEQFKPRPMLYQAVLKALYDTQK
jgi:endo-1,4-beta-xylanase